MKNKISKVDKMFAILFVSVLMIEAAFAGFGDFATSWQGILTLAAIVLLGILNLIMKDPFRDRATKTRFNWVIAIVLVVSLVWSMAATKSIVGLVPLAAGEVVQAPAGTPATTTPTTTATAPAGGCSQELLDLGFVTVGNQCSCLTSDKTTITLNDINAFSRGTAVTGGGAHRIFESTGLFSSASTPNKEMSDRGLVNDANTFETAPGKRLRIYFDENSTTDNTAAYTSIWEGLVQCTGQQTIEKEVCQLDNTPTVTVWNDDGQTNIETRGQAMGADTPYNLAMRIQATNKECAGNIFHPGKGNVLCFEFNETAQEKVEVKKNGVLMERAFKPQALSVAANNNSYCWYVPPNSNSEKLELDIVVTTDGTNNPEENISYYLYDVDVDLNADTLETIIAVEDEDQNDLGFGTTSDIARGQITVT